MIMKLIFYILTLSISALYLHQKSSKNQINNVDKLSEDMDILVPPEPIEVTGQEGLEHDKLITASISNPN